MRSICPSAERERTNRARRSLLITGRVENDRRVHSGERSLPHSSRGSDLMGTLRFLGFLEPSVGGSARGSRE